MDDKKPDEVASRLEEMHNAGKGVIGMKIFGEGRMQGARTPRRLAPLRARPRHRQRLHHRLRVDRAGRRHPGPHDKRPGVPQQGLRRRIPDKERRKHFRLEIGDWRLEIGDQESEGLEFPISNLQSPIHYSPLVPSG